MLENIENSNSDNLGGKNIHIIHNSRTPIVVKRNPDIDNMISKDWSPDRYAKHDNIMSHLKHNISPPEKYSIEVLPAIISKIEKTKTISPKHAKPEFHKEHCFRPDVPKERDENQPFSVEDNRVKQYNLYHQMRQVSRMFC